MSIRSRFNGSDVTSAYILPEPLRLLFDSVLPIGSIVDRKSFFEQHLPACEAYRVTVGDRRFSIRPAWSAYYYAPRTHIIVTGHILFCHLRPEEGWYHQPSMRLFSQDSRDRAQRFRELIQRVFRFSGGSHGRFHAQCRAA